jgi:glycosyltransferase involved in cell wall biosynthesis
VERNASFSPEAIAVVIPALDEERAIPATLADLGALGLLGTTIVADNGSVDRTAAVARAAGARVIAEPRRGYGSACLRGLDVVRREIPRARVVVFLDADRSDDPLIIPDLAAPILDGRFDLVLGSRALGEPEPGAILPHQRFGNALACGAIRACFGYRYTDLGPFRAIRLDALDRLEMSDTGFGWTVEMQVKAILSGLRILEIPVPYRPRVGRSKISGTLSGSAKAALKIGWTVAALRFRSFTPSRESS